MGHKKQSHVLSGHAGRIWSVAISPDSQTLATASGDFTVKLWHLPTRRLIDTLISHLREVRCIAFSPDGQFLASGGDDLEIRLWAV